MNSTNPFLISNNNISSNNNMLSFNTNSQNPFSASTSNNNINNNPFASINNINNTQNNQSPFNKINNNNNVSNTNGIFTTLNTSILTNNNTNNNSNFNPFLNNSNNNPNSSIFNNITNNNNYLSNNSFYNQNTNRYIMNGISFPICETFNKLPPPSFPSNSFRFNKDFEEKNNNIKNIKYNISRIESIIIDEKFRNFTAEEIRAADYINNKISFFSNWNENTNNNNLFNYSFANNNINNYGNNNNSFLQNGNGSSNFFTNNNISQNNNTFLNNNSTNNPFNNNPFSINSNNNNISSNLFNNNTNNVFNNNNNNNNSSPFMINNNNNPLNDNIFLKNNNNNNSNTSNIFNNQGTNNNSNNFNNFFSNNNNKSIFNTINNSANNLFNNNNNNNIFGNNNNNVSNNNILNNNNNTSIFNSSNTNNIFYNNNNNNKSTNGLINNISNNNNIFQNYQNPFNNILNSNNNNNSNNVNNNILVNSIFNNNQINFYEKPFEEKIKDSTWLKRNVNIIDESDLFLELSQEKKKSISKMQELQYFAEKEKENDLNRNNNFEKELTFSKIILPSDEELESNKNKKIEEENTKLEIIEEENYKQKNNNYIWDPIPIHLKNNENEYKEIYFGKRLNKNNVLYKENNNKTKRISGFTEASRILDHLDNYYIDFSSINSEQKDYILPTEGPGFGPSKFNNEINNKMSYMHYSFGDNYFVNNGSKIDNNIKNFNNIESGNLANNNNLEISNFNDINLEKNNDNNKIDIIQSEQSESYKKTMNNINNELVLINFKDNKINEKNIEENIKSSNNNSNNNFIINTESNSNTSTNNTLKRNITFNEINISAQDFKMIYSGECNTIPELKRPIIIKLSSIILNSSLLINNLNNNIELPNDSILIIDLDIAIEQIKQYISSINDIENKIVLPSDEDYFFQINGKIYSKLTNTKIKLEDIDKEFDEKNNLYFFVHYNFKLRQYPLLLNDEENNVIYETKPLIKELLDINNNYDLKKVENFEIWNKFGKVIFIDPIDLSGKAIINDIIKIKDSEIELDNPRVDKLKAKIFQNFDFGEKLEGKFLENIKAFLRNRNSTFVKYENKVLEYNMNF